MQCQFSRLLPANQKITFYSVFGAVKNTNANFVFVASMTPIEKKHNEMGKALVWC